MAQLAQSADNVKGLLQGGSQWQRTKEMRQQTMADYGAELQAQIAEKEKQKRLRRQDSLRESQQLLAQRMTVPSGLVEGVPGGYIPRPAAQQAAAALQQAAALPAAQGINNMYSQQPASHLPYVANAAPDLPYSRNPVMPNQDLMQPYGSGFSALPPNPQYSQQSAAPRPNTYDQQPSSSNYADTGSGRQQPQQGYRQSYGSAPPDYGQASAAPASYGSGPSAYMPSSAGQQTNSRGYAAPDASRQPPSPAGFSPSTTAAAAGFGSALLPSAADAKKATYRAELEAQMRDKVDAKKRERAERLQEDLQLHKEAARYNPWGKDKPGSQDRVPNQTPSHSQSQAFQQATPQQQPSNAYNGSQQGYPAGPPQQNAAAPAYGESSHDYRQQSGYYRQQSDPLSEYGQQPAAAQYSAQPDRQLSGSQGRPLYTQQSSALQSAPSGQGQPGASQPSGAQSSNRGLASAGTGAASVLDLGQNRQQQRAEVHFRSDKIHMRPEEIAAKQQKAAELQDELKQQIEAKKRAKAEEQRREREEERREQDRLQAEQERLKQQFLEEKQAEKAKRAAEAGANNKVHDAWANVKGKQPLNRRNSHLRSSSSNAEGQMQPQQPQSQQPQSQQHQPQPDQQINSNLNHQQSQNRAANRESDNGQPSSRGNSRPEDTRAGSSASYDASARMQSEAGPPAAMRSMQGAPDGFVDINAGNAMLAARQAATAQLELFRAEMAAESAKMRAVVERQQAEVAELNRRAQHAEQESAATRAEMTAVRQAAAQQNAERAIAQYAHVGRMTNLPYREAQSAREYDPLPSLSLARPASNPTEYSALNQTSFSDLAAWSATNAGDYGASLRDSAGFRPASGFATSRLHSGYANDDWEPALDQSLVADSTLIYPKAQPRPAPESLRQSAASYRPAGAPAAMRSAPTHEAGNDELQSDAVAVPLRSDGGAATPATDVDLLFSQNQSKLKALQMLEEQASQGNIEALDEFLQKFAGSAASPESQSFRDSIPAAYPGSGLDSRDVAERSITSSVRWMNAF